jgi:hypothetical protein
MVIKIYGPDFDGYSVEVDGTTILECLSEKDVKELTIGEIQKVLELDF